MPEISIITPAYNASKYIGETIDSILKQTFQDWEMIIVDDCSTDNTYEIAEKYSLIDKRIKVIRNNTNSGVATTRNRGLDVATGKYIAFLDSDDLWLPEKLEKHIQFMKKNKIAISYSYYYTFLETTNNLKKIIKAPAIMTPKKIISNTAMGCLTVIINRSVVGEFHMPLLDHAEDTCTWYELMCRGYKGFCYKEPLSLYRITNNSLSSNKRKAIKMQWKVYKNYFHFSFFKASFHFVLYAFHSIIRRMGL